MDLSRVRIVLHEVRLPDNLGAVARAMKNMGLSRLCLVNPLAEVDLARRVAVDSEEILDHALVSEDLVTALGPARFVVGTTSRAIEGRASLTPRSLADAVARETAGGDVAILFGSERRGLSNREIDHCHAVATIPSSPAKPSMNLAQAVAVIGYELYVASLTPSPPGSRPPRAEAAALERLYERMRELLLEAGFLSPQNPDLILSELKRCFERSEPTPREAELWLAAFKQLERAIRS
jgi:tRNA/rRNA methyltransferase